MSKTKDPLVSFGKRMQKLNFKLLGSKMNNKDTVLIVSNSLQFTICQFKSYSINFFGNILVLFPHRIQLHSVYLDRGFMPRYQWSSECVELRCWLWSSHKTLAHPSYRLHLLPVYYWAAHYWCTTGSVFFFKTSMENLSYCLDCASKFSFVASKIFSREHLS